MQVPSLRVSALAWQNDIGRRLPRYDFSRSNYLENLIVRSKVQGVHLSYESLDRKSWTALVTTPGGEFLSGMVSSEYDLLVPIL